MPLPLPPRRRQVRAAPRCCSCCCYTVAAAGRGRVVPSPRGRQVSFCRRVVPLPLCPLLLLCVLTACCLPAAAVCGLGIEVFGLRARRSNTQQHRRHAMCECQRGCGEGAHCSAVQHACMREDSKSPHGAATHPRTFSSCSCSASASSGLATTGSSSSSPARGVDAGQHVNQCLHAQVSAEQPRPAAATHPPSSLAAAAAAAS